MKVRNAAVFSLLLVVSAASTAFCGNDSTLGSAKGLYEGPADVYDGHRTYNRTYAVTVYDVKDDTQELSLKFRCEECKNKQWLFKSCKATSVAPDLIFECHGDLGSGNFQLTNQVLTGKGTFSKGPVPFSFKATRKEP